MNWIKPEDKIPAYYEVIDVRLKTGETFNSWMASDGERNLWRKHHTNEVFYDEDILEWRRKEIKPKTL